MNGIIQALVLTAAALTLAWVAARRGPKSILLEQWTVGGLAVAVVVTLGGLVFARLGWFSGWAVAAALFGSALLLRWRGVQAPQPRATESSTTSQRLWQIAVVVAGLLLLIFCVVGRFHEVEGMRDPGIYTATGIELSRTGDFGWADPVIEQYGLEAARPFLIDWKDFHQGKPRWERTPGFAVRDESTGWIRPQFLGGYEVWLALAFGVGGAQATQCVNALFAVLAALSFFCLLRRLAGISAAGFATLFLCMNPAQLWFARFTSNEMMMQAFLWGFAFLFVAAEQESDSAGGRAEAGELPARRFAYWLAMAVLSAAVLVKFATWILLPMAAFAAGFSQARGELPIRRWAVSVFLPLIGVAAWVNAYIFADYYLWGSWAFSLGRAGIPFWVTPILFISSIFVALLAGRFWALRGPRWVPDFWNRTTARKVFLWGGGLVVALAWVYQTQLLTRLSGSDTSVWDERTNLAEFSFYLSALGFLAGLAGLVEMVRRISSRRLLVFLLLLTGSAYFLWQRRLDALHPWGARRWVPFLFPAWCAGMGYLVDLLWRKKNTVARVSASVAALLLIGSMTSSAPQLIRARNFRGFIPSLDKIASHLRSDDLVLGTPTPWVGRSVPYLKARFDLDLYIQPSAIEDWNPTIELAKVVAKEGRRVMLLANTPVARETTGPAFLLPVAEEHIRCEVLWDSVHALRPDISPVDERIEIFELKPDLVPANWSPTERLPATPIEIAQFPLNLSIAEIPEGLMEGFFGLSPLPDETFFRWTNGNARLSLGQMLMQAPAFETLRVTFQIASRRPSTPVPVSIYLNLGSPQPIQLYPLQNVGVDFEEVSVELQASDLKSTSLLEIQSLKPAVGDTVTTGALGVAVKGMRFEAVK